MLKSLFHIELCREWWKHELPEHTTLASSPWLQLCSPQGLVLHAERSTSVPLHSMSSSQIGPVPSPKWAEPGADSGFPQSSCLHTTMASDRSHLSSHTVPHCCFQSTSSRPAQRLGPSTSLMGAELATPGSEKKIKVENEHKTAFGW